MLEPRSVDAFAQNEAITNHHNLATLGLGQDFGPCFAAGSDELASQPHVLAVNMGRADADGLELLGEPDGLTHTRSEEDRWLVLGIEPLEPFQHPADNPVTHHHL